MAKKFLTPIQSTVATGTAPLVVASTTGIANLNADLLDGQHGTFYAPINAPTFTGTLTAPTVLITTTDTATAASHYIVENGSDGIIRPKTLANTRTEIVTTAAVNSAAATTVGTITSGTWNATDISLAAGGTNASLTAINGGAVYSTGTALAITAVGTSGQVLVSAGASAPAWTTLTLENLPDAAYKKSVKAATTAAITLSAPQTIDGIAVIAGDRVLVKDQAASATNGIYIVQAAGWTRSLDADSITEIAGATVNVDSGTINGSQLWSNSLKTTDTLGTTAMIWQRLLNTADLLGSTSTAIGAIKYNGTTAAAGHFDGGTTTPTGTTRLNYGGYFYPTFINLAGSGDTATAATHYMVETGSDGFVRPKTLANTRTEIVTTAAVNSAAPTTVGTISSGVWQGTAINATYIDSAIARLASPTFTGTVTIPILQPTTGIKPINKSDITTRTEGGFFEHDAATTVKGWPETTNSWYHLISSTHSNDANYYSLQIAGSFFDQKMYFRKTNGSGTTGWTQIATMADVGGGGLDPFFLGGM